MTDIINLLPDSVANQIAAGEVIQRPASVVKELVENSIDAGATQIQIVIKDGGNSLIQVIDNGKGMSPTDARMSFERHATSKINDASDLFSLHTMGFRGEALASVAAVAQVELKTRREEDDLGTYVEIAATRVFKQESIQCDKGTSISVKNLFFNVPARRRFLKSQSTEMMHVRNELYRIVLVYPDIAFTLFDGTNELMQLSASSLKGRIERVFGLGRQKMEQQLLPVSVSTNMLNIKGFVGKPEFAKKSANQYFFVNGRFMRHPYFHKAVMLAYDKLIKPGEGPSYFIYFEAAPQSIDVNVHPSKTEIKFEDEQAIWRVVQAAVKEVLGKFHVAPSLDFNQDESLDIPVLDSHTTIVPPKTNFNPSYNPFGASSGGVHKRPVLDWEKLYGDFKQTNADFGSGEDDLVQYKVEIETTDTQKLIDLGLGDADVEHSDLFQFKAKYICTSVRSGLMLIDQHRAHSRVLFNQYLSQMERNRGVSQRVLFPDVLELNSHESEILQQSMDDLRAVGFEIEVCGENTYTINGIPSEIDMGTSILLLKDLLADSTFSESKIKGEIRTAIALLMSRRAAIQHGMLLSQVEMKQLLEDLFRQPDHLYSPDGKTVMIVIENAEIEDRF